MSGVQRLFQLDFTAAAGHRKMPSAYLIGTDEAGYGPNLGPLVVSATMWELPDQLLGANLYDLLADAVSDDGRDVEGGGRIAIADSKSLYHSGGSMAVLERGVLAVLATLGDRPANWQQVFDTLAPGNDVGRAALPWYGQFQQDMPVHADAEDAAAWGERLRRTMEGTGVRLCRVCSRVLWVPQFNESVRIHGNKACVLSRTTLGLVRDLIGEATHGSIRVLCDKHGGRNKYAGLLQEMAGTGLVQVVTESRAESRYRFGPPSRRVDIRFTAGGEQFLPAALASMVSKFLRELAMMALNRYWCGVVDGLKPTAGYPTDAKRWLGDVAATKQELRIDDRLLWRCR
jgi:ribonuclease HII